MQGEARAVGPPHVYGPGAGPAADEAPAVPAAAKAAAKGAASSSRNVKAKPAACAEVAAKEAAPKQGDTLDSKEEGDLLDSKEDIVQELPDCADTEGDDTEGAASRAEDNTEEAADPPNKPAAKVRVSIAHVGKEGGGC